MDRELLRQLVLDVNSKKNDVGIPRAALKDVERYARTSHILVITGPRRAGKSTLLRQFMRGRDDCHYFSFDDERLAGFTAADFSLLMDVFVGLYGEKKLLILDEIQNAAGWERFTNRMHREGKKVILTGSNARLLSREFATHLTGRHLDILLFPFSFREYLSFQEIKLPDLERLTSAERGLLANAHQEYVSDGGFPEYLKSREEDVLSHLYEDIILKDVVLRHSVKERESLKAVAFFLISNVARPFTFTRLRDAFSIKTTPTVISFVSFLEETYLFLTVKRFSPSLKVQSRSPRKVYCVDNGLINAVAFKNSIDQGYLLENEVFLHLRLRHDEIYSFKNGRECDFLVKQGNSVTEAIQACHTLNAENKEREVQGLLEAMHAFRLSKGLILTASQEETIDVEGKHINVRPVWKWLLSSST